MYKLQEKQQSRKNLDYFKKRLESLENKWSNFAARHEVLRQDIEKSHLVTISLAEQKRYMNSQKSKCYISSFTFNNNQLSV